MLQANVLRRLLVRPVTVALGVMAVNHSAANLVFVV